MSFKFSCARCEYFTNCNRNFNRHMASAKHLKKLKYEDIYTCKKCSYKTTTKQDYDKHCKSKKCCKQIREKPSLKIADIHQQIDYMDELIETKESEMLEIQKETNLHFGLPEGETYPDRWLTLYDEVDELHTLYHNNFKRIRLWKKKMNKLFPIYIHGLIKFWKECTINSDTLYALD